MNGFGNRPHKVYDRFKQEGLGMLVLYAGDTLDTDHPEAHNNEQALERYEDLYTKGEKVIDKPPVVSLDKIREAVKKRSEQLHSKFPKWMLKKLQPVIIQIPDLNTTVELCLNTGEVRETANKEFDLVIYSQPLHFSFDTTWGLQTMGVGARFRIRSKHGVWKWYRIITSLNNAEMYLKFRYLFTKDNIAFVRARMKGGLNQLFYQLKRMEA